MNRYLTRLQIQEFEGQGDSRRQLNPRIFITHVNLAITRRYLLFFICGTMQSFAKQAWFNYNYKEALKTTIIHFFSESLIIFEETVTTYTDRGR